MCGLTIIWLTKQFLASSSSRIDGGAYSYQFRDSDGQAGLPHHQVQQGSCKKVVLHYRSTEVRDNYFHSSWEGHNSQHSPPYRFL